MTTVGKILKKGRKEKGCDISEASEALKIHPRFLKALENGDYSIFAHPLHIKGFLKNYAEFLGLNVPQVLAFWRREYKNASHPIPIRDVTKPLKAPKIAVTPQVAAAVSTFILVIAFLGYLFWQYRSIAGPPSLEVLSPKKDLVVSDPQITLKGTAGPQSCLEINGQKILVGEDGKFSLEYVLSDGTNILSFIAENEFGKRTEVTRRVVYEKPEVLRLPAPETSPSGYQPAPGPAAPEATASAAP